MLKIFYHDFYNLQLMFSYSRNRFKTYEVCMDYCDEVMRKDMSSNSNGNVAETSDFPPERGRLVVILYVREIVFRYY